MKQTKVYLALYVAILGGSVLASQATLNIDATPTENSETTTDNKGLTVGHQLEDGKKPGFQGFKIDSHDDASHDSSQTKSRGIVSTAINNQQKVVQPKSAHKDVSSDEDSSSQSGTEDVSVALTQDFGGDADSVAFNFEDVDLKSVAEYMERVHRVKFVTEDVVASNTQAKGFAGHKISFRTNSSLTKKESWNLFLTFLNMAALDVVPMAQKGFYRVVPLPTAPQEPVPTYIGVDAASLPDNDMVIRYIYFVQNLDTTNIQQLMTKLQGSSGSVNIYGELKALIFTDKSYNIKSLMKIVKELDRATMPQVLSVIKLSKANVSDVIKLYESLKPSTSTQPQRAWAPSHKASSLEYFPQNVVLSGDERTNALIILGSEDAVKRIEDFVQNHVDVDINKKVQPIYTYYLEYTNALDIQKMLSTLVQYGSSSSAGKYGGVRDGYKYLQQMTIVADPHTNALVINSTEEDYRIVEKLIKKLDVPQKQVALEVLLVQVKDTDTKQLGSQISGPNATNTFLKSVSAQTSGIPPGSGIVALPGTDTNYTIKTSLASLLGGTLGAAGSTLVTFGKPIWALFKILKTIASTKIIANPFGVTTNNSAISMTMGSQRRVVTGTVYSSGNNQASGFSDASASLVVNITPQINDEGIVNLDIDIQNSQFVNDDTSDSVQDKKSIKTVAALANGEVLVLGGIMVDNLQNSKNGVPLLSKIPILGWLFKSKSKKSSRESFVVFICPKILDDTKDRDGLEDYSNKKMDESYEYMKLLEKAEIEDNKRDPINRNFFGNDDTYGSSQLMSERNVREAEMSSRSSRKTARKYKKMKKTTRAKRKTRVASRKKSKESSKKTTKKVVIPIEKNSQQKVEKNTITNTVRNSPGVYYYD